MKTKRLASIIETLEPRLAPAGTVLLTTAGGVLTITGDPLGNTIRIAELSSGTSWNIVDHFGTGTLFSLNGAAPVASVIFPSALSIKATLNGGDDTLRLQGIDLGGTLNVLGNDGADFISLFDTKVFGAATLDTGNGADTVSQEQAIFMSTYSLKTGTGIDTVSFLGGVAVFGRGLTVDLGSDSNFFSVSADELNVFGNVNVTAAGGVGAAQDLVFGSADGFVSGSVTLKTVLGDASFKINSDVDDFLTVTGGVLLQSAAGTDVFTLAGTVRIGTALNFLAGAGTNSVNSVSLAAMKLGSLTYTGGANDDNFNLRGTDVFIAGNVTINGLAGTNSFEIITTRFNSTGSLLYTGGDGTDTFNIRSTESNIGGQFNFKGGNGSNTASFQPTEGRLGSFAYTGGTGSDNAAIGNIGGFSNQIRLLGNVSMMTGAGSSIINVYDSIFLGTFTASSMVGVGGSDFFDVNDSTFMGAVNLSLLGDANAFVDINNVNAHSTVKIGTGGGSDTVKLDTDFFNPGTKSIFSGAVTILLGAGDDTFNAGEFGPVANVGCDFNASLLVDGGLGADTANFIAATFGNTFLIPITAAHRPGVETFN